MRKLHFGVLITTLLLLGGLVGYSLVHNGYVPVALVNGDLVLLKEIEENTAVSRQLYQSGLVQDEAGEYARLFTGTEGQEELVRKVFERLIENAIIHTSVSSEVQSQAETQIEESLNSADASRLGSSLKQLYGWDVDAFTDRILRPQALQEAAIDAHGDQYETWIRTARQNAEVRIWFLPYEWQKGELVSK